MKILLKTLVQPFNEVAYIFVKIAQTPQQIQKYRKIPILKHDDYLRRQHVGAWNKLTSLLEIDAMPYESRRHSPT